MSTSTWRTGAFTGAGAVPALRRGNGGAAFFGAGASTVLASHAGGAFGLDGGAAFFDAGDFDKLANL